MFCLTQYQAGQAEKQIKVEFERLHNALYTEEALRLKALAAEEEQKIAAIQEQIANTSKDITALKELIDTLKKEMGNEDLPLLKVKDEAAPPQFTSIITVYFVLSLMFKCFQDLYKKCIKLISVSLFYILEFPEFKKKVSICKIHCCNHTHVYHKI